MADLADMPPLVDRPASDTASREPSSPPPHAVHPQYVDAPFVYAPGAQMPPMSPWGNQRADNGVTWSPYPPSQSMSPSQWLPHPSSQWASMPPYFAAPGAQPAPVNPTMSRGADWWQRDAMSDDTPDRQQSDYFGKPEESGWHSSRSSSRPLSPLSNSTPSPLSSNSGVSRSRSMRSFGGESAKRPPRDWRVDFSMSKSLSLGASLGSLVGRARSVTMPGGNAPKMPKLHPYLRHLSSTPPMHLDLRLSPSTLRFRTLDRRVNEWDLTRFACEPPVPIVRLYNPHYPWYIDVNSSNPAGVTLHELFGAIYQSMMTPITHADYWNSEMDEALRERIAYAWVERCADDEERKKGVLRVDFLMDRVIMEGLVKGKDGMWEMKIKKL
ncbi:uncharacterized protein LAESUDRAFT_728034 [Laetiporus sulphureus 93-53]|uniref:DUF6699 domain-containing protein n=1 Tax=Laetiporus sulphureus 93-53 TaxID=1314785 RepID=A0A165DC99_9APHY|nr:uncharacterized protein LAESUDRAFT_728034 [Laetiporus sulphureus 93-53]KZT04544.1 hypothetical protein LAESUDRAFT_728034 [Laetiporus sulphureus 93-53]